MAIGKALVNRRPNSRPPSLTGKGEKGIQSQSLLVCQKASPLLLPFPVREGVGGLGSDSSRRVVTWVGDLDTKSAEVYVPVLAPEKSPRRSPGNQGTPDDCLPLLPPVARCSRARARHFGDRARLVAGGGQSAGQDHRRDPPPR